MDFRKGSRLAALFACLLAPSFVGAQTPTNPPSPAEAQRLLQTRPDLVAQLVARLRQSGLTPEQIRARLKAQGYPEDLLDAYIPGGDSTKAPPVSDQALKALRSLNLPGTAASTPMTASELSEPTSVPAATAGLTSPLPVTEGGVSVFGVDVFRRTTSQFDPVLAGPVDASYRVGPRDILQLTLTGGVEASYPLEVTREGTVLIPRVGELSVANLTLDQVRDLLYSRLGRVYSGIRRGSDATTFFSITVSKLRANQVFVLGDVSVPGSYTISSVGTALTALYTAGGPTINGTMRNIEIRRFGKLAGTLDLYDYLIRGDASKDERLENGDVVFVPFRGKHVTIVGQIGRPAIYELRAGETLRDLLQISGGLLPSAGRRRVQIQRILPPAQRSQAGLDRVTIDITSEELASAQGPATPLEGGDMVTVFAVEERQRNRVLVAGDVWTPGPVGFTPGMRLSQAVRLAGGVKPDVFRDQLLITRRMPDDSRISLRTSFRDSLGTPLDDIEVKEDDEIRIFSISEFRPAPTITILGAVQRDTILPFHEGMTLRDAILLARGLSEGAYLKEVEIARMPESRANGQMAETIRAPLDSSYLFSRSPDGRFVGLPGLPTGGPGTSPETPLKPYDNILVFKQPEWQLTKTVSINGQVAFPGNYTVQNHRERISGLLVRAGGLTGPAYAHGARFFRRADSIGRIDIDLEKLVRMPGSREDFLLQPGDSLHIPEYNPVVKVVGAVGVATSVAWVPGRDLRYYIDAAGGVARNGDLGRSYVTQPNGRVESYRDRFLFIPDGVPKPEPGAEVRVPVADETKRDAADLAKAIAQGLISMAAILVVALK